MAIEKGLYAAPLGLSDAALAEPEIEIEIEDPESVSIGIDGLEIDIEPGEESADDFDANLAEYIDEGTLSELAADLLGDFDDDIASRKDWMEAYVKGLKLLGLKREEKTEPWNGACGVFHPMLTEAVVRFQSESIVETFPAAGPVKTQIMGAIDQLKEDAAARVRDDMNYKLTEEMVEYRPEHEKMLWALPLAGSAFKKVYFDPSLGRQVAMFIPAEDIVVPYGASSLETAERVTHVMRKTKNELKKLRGSGFYKDEDLGDPVAVLDDVDKEKAREEGYSTTIEKGTKTILAIRRNWYEDDELKLKRNHLVHYVYVPGFGFYGFGFIHLIGGYAEAATMIMRQLVDAGTLSNLPGGLKTKGLRIKGDDTPINPGEFRDVDVPSGSIRDNILPLPYKEPSQTLYQLLGNIIDEGRSFASAGDINVSDMSNEAPVGTTLAILERTLKVNTAVQGRLHYAMRQEFKLLKTIIRDYTPEEYEYDPEEGDRQVKQADYDMVEVIPVSDPNASTMAQKIVQYQAVMQLAQQAPQLYDLPLLHRQMIEVLGVKNANKLVPTEDDQTPTDPISENQNILTGKPVKAFMEQNHEAHIQIHMSAMQDPSLMKLMENDPSAPAKQAAAMAHINEHLAFEYRRRIEETLGVQLPTEDETKNMSPEIASEVAALCARAAQQLLQQNQQQAAEEQAQQLAEDPVVQMQQQELQIKQQELDRKARKDLTDAIAKSDQMKLEQARIQAQLQIAGLQAGMKAAKDKEELKGKMTLEGLKIGSQAAKDKAQMAMSLLQQGTQKTAQPTPPKKGKPK